MITATTIHEALVNELVGKEYKQYNADVNVSVILRTLAQNEGLNTDMLHVWTDNRQSLDIKYNHHIIGRIEVKKSKGESHYKYGETWCDWSYKDFDVSLYKDTLQECYSYVADLIVAENDKSKKDAEQGVEALKVLMDHFGVDKYGARKMCDYINKHFYSL